MRGSQSEESKSCKAPIVEQEWKHLVGSELNQPSFSKHLPFLASRIFSDAVYAKTNMSAAIDYKAGNISHVLLEADLFLSSSTSLYPVVPGNGRFVSENEVILDNYWFPKKVGRHGYTHTLVCL